MRSVTETLKLISDFSEKIGSFSKRENKLNYAEKLRDSNRRQSLEEQQSQVEEQLQIQREDTENWITHQVTGLTAIYESRKSQIEKARMTVRTSVLEGIRKDEGAQKFELQRQMMDSSKQREAGIKAARAQSETDNAAFIATDAQFSQLEEATLKAYRPFTGTRKKLALSMEGKGPKDNIPELSADELVEQFPKIEKLANKVIKNPLVNFYRIIPIWVQLII
ncbi:MAG: hypothetical protein AAF226_18990, partial [Verrucomicrobiota bacterium]